MYQGLNGKTNFRRKNYYNKYTKSNIFSNDDDADNNTNSPPESPDSNPITKPDQEIAKKVNSRNLPQTAPFLPKYKTYDKSSYQRYIDQYYNETALNDTQKQDFQINQKILTNEFDEEDKEDKIDREHYITKQKKIVDFYGPSNVVVSENVGDENEKLKRSKSEFVRKNCPLQRFAKKRIKNIDEEDDIYKNNNNNYPIKKGTNIDFVKSNVFGNSENPNTNDYCNNNSNSNKNNVLPDNDIHSNKSLYNLNRKKQQLDQVFDEAYDNSIFKNLGKNQNYNYNTSIYNRSSKNPSNVNSNNISNTPSSSNISSIPNSICSSNTNTNTYTNTNPYSYDSQPYFGKKNQKQDLNYTDWKYTNLELYHQYHLENPKNENQYYGKNVVFSQNKYEDNSNKIYDEYVNSHPNRFKPPSNNNSNQYNGNVNDPNNKDSINIEINGPNDKFNTLDPVEIKKLFLKNGLHVFNFEDEFNRNDFDLNGKLCFSIRKPEDMSDMRIKLNKIQNEIAKNGMTINKAEVKLKKVNKDRKATPGKELKGGYGRKKGLESGQYNQKYKNEYLVKKNK